MKEKIFDQVRPYSYLITRLADGMNYVGIRYGNVKKGLTPEQDFSKIYFSSGEFKVDFKKNPSKYKYRLVYSFDSPAEAAEWEYKVLLKVYKRPTWANMTAAWSFTDRDKIGKNISEGKRKIKDNGKSSIEEGAESLKKFIYETEDGVRYRQDISKRVKEFRASLSEERQSEINDKRNATMDFFSASKKAQETMSKIGEDGLTTLQRKARKSNATRAAKGEDLSARAKAMNDALNKHYLTNSVEHKRNKSWPCHY